MTPAEILRKAADNIEGDPRPLWHGEVLLESDRRYCDCAYLAILHAKDGKPESWESVEFSSRYLSTFLGLDADHIDSLFAWNDVPERTKEEVVQALRDCAATL